MKRGVLAAILVLFLLLVSNPIHADEQNIDKIDNFRGIKWGLGIEQVADMIIYQKRGALCVYVRSNDLLKIWGTSVEDIHYVFRDGKFSCALIYFKGDESAKTLKKAFFDNYGVVLKEPRTDCEQYHWMGEVVGITFTYNSDSRRGDIFFNYLPLSPE